MSEAVTADPSPGAENDVKSRKSLDIQGQAPGAETTEFRTKDQVCPHGYDKSATHHVCHRPSKNQLISRLRAAGERGENAVLMRDAINELESLRQFHEWALPQITTHGADLLEIERLRRTCDQHLQQALKNGAESQRWAERYDQLAPFYKREGMQALMAKYWPDVRLSDEKDDAPLRRIIEAYDAYRRRGVLPAPSEYADVVAAIEAARPAVETK